MALTGLCAVPNFDCVFSSLPLHPQLRNALTALTALAALPCLVLPCPAGWAQLSFAGPLY